MAEREYRIYVQSTDTIGHQFLIDCVNIGKLGAEIDPSQIRQSFPHNAVFFLKTDKVFENTPTTTYTVLSQLFTSEEDLDALTIDEWRNEMKKVGIKARDRAAGTAEYMNKFMPEKVATPEVVVEAQETPLEATEVVEDTPTPQLEEKAVVEAPIEPEVVVEETVTKQRGRKAK